MSRRIAGGVIGIVFGVVLSWSGMASPAIIREGLLFQSSYLFLFFAGAMLTATVGLRILKLRAPKALLTGETVQWEPVKPERRHVVGSAVFGVGWGISGACPAPIAAQLGQGIPWGVPLTIGLIAGVLLFGRLQRRAERAPARRSARAVEPVAGGSGRQRVAPTGASG